MRKLLTIMALTVAGTSASAQCSVAIPPTAIPVVYDGSYIFAGQWIWLCPGGGVNVLSGGTNNHFLVESGDTLGLGGGSGNPIYAKGNTFLYFFPGAMNYEVYHEASTVIVDNGTGNTFTECTEVIFDYTDAPAGCTVGIDEASAPASMEVFPSPVEDVLTVNVDPKTTVFGVRIADLSGRVVLQERGAAEMQIDLQALQTGTYIVMVTTDAGDLTRRVVKN